MRESIRKKLTIDGVHADMFAEAQEEVFNMMERDSYPRFLALKAAAAEQLDPMQRENAIRHHATMSASEGMRALKQGNIFDMPPPPPV